MKTLNFKLYRLFIISFLALFAHTSYGQVSQDGGFKYQDYSIASNIYARVRCNYTYDDFDDDGVLNWHTAASLKIVNNSPYDIKIEYEFIYEPERGRYCSNKNSIVEYKVLKAGQSKVFCASGATNSFNPNSTWSFFRRVRKILPTEFKLTWEYEIIQPNQSTAGYDVKRFKSLIRSGQDCYSRKVYSCAINYFEQAYKINPNSQEAETGLVNATAFLADNYFSNKQYGLAIEYFNKVLKLRPTRDYAKRKIQQALEAIDKKKRQKNESETYSSLKVKANSTENTGNYQQALDYYIEMKLIIQNSSYDKAGTTTYVGSMNFINSKIATLEKKIKKQNSVQAQASKNSQSVALQNGTPAQSVTPLTNRTVSSNISRDINKTQSISRLIQEARNAYGAGDTQRSIQLLNQAKSQDPNNSQIDKLLKQSREWEAYKSLSALNVTSANASAYSTELNAINTSLEQYISTELDPTTVALTKTLSSTFSTGDQQLDNLATNLGLALAASSAAKERRLAAERAEREAKRAAEKAKEQKEINSKIKELISRYNDLSCNDILKLSKLWIKSETMSNKDKLMISNLNKLNIDCYNSLSSEDKWWVHERFSEITTNNIEKIVHIKEELNFIPENMYKLIYNKMYSLYNLLDDDDRAKMRNQLTNYYYASIVPNKKNIYRWNYRSLKQNQKELNKVIDKKTLKAIKKNPEAEVDLSFMLKRYDYLRKMREEIALKKRLLNENKKEVEIKISASTGYKGVNKKDDVRIVQCLLNQFKAKNNIKGRLVVDGLYGKNTRAVIIKFQKTHQLEATGLITPDGEELKLLIDKADNVLECKD